jgi:hypothetical protein
LTKAELYAKKYLKRDIDCIQNSDRNIEFPNLTVYEKAVIYKYTEDGYENINELLRSSKGMKSNEFASVLNNSLTKIDNYEGQVFRCADLNAFELEKYVKAEKEGVPITEYTFISTTKSELTALAFGKNTKFVIYSKTGKEIEKISKFGKHNPPNEKEVLFKSGRSFNILEIIEEPNQTVITMEEV